MLRFMGLQRVRHDLATKHSTLIMKREDRDCKMQFFLYFLASSLARRDFSTHKSVSLDCSHSFLVDLLKLKINTSLF